MTMLRRSRYITAAFRNAGTAEAAWPGLPGPGWPLTALRALITTD